VCILGNGVVINPNILLEDFAALEANSIDYSKKIIVSQRAHLVTAYHHKIKDRLRDLR
jgi:adenylosuccinate synthase